MAQSAKKVNYYRLALRRGKLHKMELSEDDRLVGNGAGSFTYFAPVYDSGEADATWHRFQVEGSCLECRMEIYVAATNLDLSSDLWSDDMTDEERIEYLTNSDHMTCVRMVGTDDFLLHSLTGRYLWIMIRVSAAKQIANFRIEGFSVEFPAGSFISYLPEIYQTSERNSFFERYMAVLQSLYEDLEDQVSNVPVYLDVDTTPDENLPLFAQWTGNWHADKNLTPDQLRFLLKSLQEIQSGKGTEHVLQKVLCLITGQPAVIVEYFKWHDWMKGRSTVLDEYQDLFGQNEDMFTVIIRDMDGRLSKQREYVRKILQEYVPLGMSCNLVWLEWNSQMDSHCYLDTNSRLSAPVAASTGGMVLGNQIVLG